MTDDNLILSAIYEEGAPLMGRIEPLNEEQKQAIHDAMNAAADAAIKNKDAITGTLNNLVNSVLTDDTRQLLRDITADLQAIQDAINELEALEPFIEEELQKPEYGGATLKGLLKEYTPADLLTLPADSVLYRVWKEAKRRSVIDAQQQGRKARQAMRARAKGSGAIMEIKGGNLAFFSNENLWDAFAPGRICRMGTLDKNVIDKETGLVKKAKFAPGEIENLEPGEISVKAFSLLSAITKNTVDNIYEEFVKGGNITFYVKGVLEKFTDDPRTLNDNQLTLDRKTAGVLYLERLFEPLQGYIGTIANGSRYSVFNYIGYDALTDTMTVQTPYLYQQWKSTQASYFERQKKIEAAHEEGKKAKKADYTPLETNELFKNKAFSANEITLEIAVYITNVLLTAGNTGKIKKTEILYRTLIKNCPRFAAKLDEIDARPNIEILEDGTTQNNSSLYNMELKKIKSAFDLILDPNRCDATAYYEFVDIQPAKVKKNGRIAFTAPTKSKLDGKIIICWQRKPDELL